MADIPDLLNAALERQKSETNPLLRRIARRVHDIIGIDNLRTRLDRGDKIVEYQGYDPTKPNLHLGHLVSLLIHRDLQEEGHTVIFLLGGFTAMIGDPTGKTTARPALTLDQVRENSLTYQDQVGRIIDFSHPTNPVQLRNNHDWLSQLSLSDWFSICQLFTLTDMMGRDMFKIMQGKGEPIHMHSLQYPLLQGYDSVHMRVDMEIGGSDQLFNMVVGRDLVRFLQEREKFVLTTHLLDTTGGGKMGKTEGNAISLTSTPTEMFAGLMKVDDKAVINTLVLLTDVPLEEIEELRGQLTGAKATLSVKERMAFEVVSLYFGREKAEAARGDYHSLFVGERPESISQKTLTATTTISLATLVHTHGLSNSRKDAELQVRRGDIKIDGVVHDDPEERFEPEELVGRIIQAGKRRYFKLVAG